MPLQNLSSKPYYSEKASSKKLARAGVTTVCRPLKDNSQKQPLFAMRSGKLLVIFTCFGPRHRAKAAVLHAHDPEAAFLEIAGSSETYFWESSPNNLPFQFFRLFPSKKKEELSRIRIIPPLIKTLDDINPDIIMYHGLLEPGFQAIAVWSKVNNIPAILHHDSWHDNKSRIPWLQYAKGKLYRYFYQYAFVAGRYSKDYLISMGYPEKNIFLGCDVVDNDYFKEKSAKFREQEVFREREGLPANYFLVVARYSPEKDHATLLEAYKQYVDSGGDWKLVLIGEGPLRDQIKDQIDALGLANNVIQRGWISYEKMPLYYAFAKCLILPSSSEPWGLVANEAAACGLPLILSNKCGCVPELCQPGVNGFVFESANVEKLSECMKNISNNSVDLSAFGVKSRELVSTLTFENWALQVLKMKEIILHNGNI
jgi:1,2-diacylglycerol 3-alpha-glucosyltransferase